ncbi:MAG: signal recognition particle-docking protein FtsY [Bacillota bacterium]|jgi:fused signal recognition particle receptor|nr:signal recognition particle-docking protein FtsY [Bacillota bacterium]HOB91785.1 signal recognition particle-docking protein FtsY [Bacillota bacterium]HPZ55191.1 signal recognition particle-docking protein FtsY [Bacillota bacterium]HQD18606.1 signal recognition particle-docking protein FtsY [Bacillota bacterium]
MDRKISFLDRLKQGLRKTREGFVGRLETLLKGKKTIDSDLLDELEELLIEADLGVGVVIELIDNLKERVSQEGMTEPEDVKEVLKQELLSLVGDETVPLRANRDALTVIMVVGVNGTGKTTTVGKLAAMLQSSGSKVLIAAADTFRAAAIEQLEIWGRRSGAEVIRQQQGSDPAAVVYDAAAAAKSRGVDYLLIDTAGRLHTKVNLMEELKKIRRVVGREVEGAPHEVLLVIDATTGQNGITQARLFKEAVDVTGIVLTKLDGTAKGGIAVSIGKELAIPVKLIGVGEAVEDLREFDPRLYVEALFSS